jgi:hypothetical protein
MRVRGIERDPWQDRRAPPSRRTASVACPVLFMVQWDDEIFDREGALELFNALGTSDKRMHVHPGKHGAFPLEAADATRTWLAGQLQIPAHTTGRS